MRTIKAGPACTFAQSDQHHCYEITQTLSIAEQTEFSHTRSETLKTGFLASLHAQLHLLYLKAVDGVHQIKQWKKFIPDVPRRSLAY